jgi:spore germination cell wall hydrolase CwlJ-like protein
VLPEGSSHRRPEVFAIPESAPTPARIPRRFLEQRIVPKTTRLFDEFTCLSTAIYFEARGETYLGQVGVAQVILNRVAHPSYPKTICDVVYQAAHLHNKCQFSFACDGVADLIREPRAWRWAKRVARSVLFRNNNIVDLRAATNYHATYVSPRWAGGMRKLLRIGLHVFYKA